MMKDIFTSFSNVLRPQCMAALAMFALMSASEVLWATDGPPVLGRNGDVYEVAAGTYGSLFPGGSQASADADVLRLQVRRGSGTVEHHVVPGSEPDDSDRTPSLFFDAATGRLYVVWSSSNTSTLTRINLASFDGSEWAETIEVSGNIYSDKSAPRLAVTHDRFELAGGAAGDSSTRTVLHVVWSENTADGEKVMYAPVVLVDGELASTWRRVHRLNDYVSQGLVEHQFTGEVATKLLTAPTVDAAAEPNAVVIGLADSATGALVQLELSTPATELSELAGSLADYLDSSDLCTRIETEGSDAITSVASAARHHIVIVGRRIRSRALAPIADDVRDHLVSQASNLCAEGGLTRVTSSARHHIVIVGVRAQQGDLLKGPADGTSHVLLAAAQEVGGGGYVQHLARLQVKSERIAPVIGDGEPTILVSPTGTGAIVVWENGQTLTYVETAPGVEDWSSPHTLRIDGNLSRAEAYSILRDRARSLE